METILDEKTRRKETASSEKRHWVRLTRICNNRCVFCLDRDSHDGSIVPFEQLCGEFRRGIELGCTRVILSGGEATLHPDFKKLVRRARAAGYKRIQLVTNGRMFAYQGFLDDAIQAGLDEITFSIHGHTPRLHDAQTGIPGSFHQTLMGLVNALNSGRLIVNIDIVINKHNYRLMDQIMDYFIKLGVHEFDLLHVTPFGSAWENRESVFYDPAKGIKHLNRAFEYSRREELFVWTNRFPPNYLTEYPELIQNPVKIKDEVRGRKDAFDDFINSGQRISCRGGRCQYCFLRGLCDELFAAQKKLAAGNPASLRVAADQLKTAVYITHPDAMRRLRIYGKSSASLGGGLIRIPDQVSLHFELGDYTGFARAIAGRPTKKITASASDPQSVDTLLSLPDLRVDVEINETNSDVIREISRMTLQNRIRLFYRNRTDLAGSCSDCVDMTEFFQSSKMREFKTINVPGCLVKTAPVKYPRFLDIGTLALNGRIDMQKLTDGFIEHRYYVFPAGCEKCVARRRCPGLHVNYHRAFGFKPCPIKNKVKK